MEYRYIGQDVKRVDAYDKVTGAAVFGADIDLPHQLYGAVCRSPYPHAKILSVDISKARELPGVKAIVNGKDNPVLYGAVIADEPFLAFDKVRYYGEPVAAVAADTLETAREAVRLIKVEYAPLPIVEDVLHALDSDSPVLHDSWSAYKKFAKVAAEDGTNLCDKFLVRKGDVARGFQEADVIIENQYKTALIQHVTIETHAASVKVGNRGQITCWTSAQSPFVVRQYFSQTLGLSLNDVRIIGTYVGGGFGSKYDLRAEQIAYMLANEVRGIPVKVVFDRTEDFIGSVTRGEAVVKIKTGATSDGKIVAQEIDIFWDTGAYTTMGPRVAQNGAIAASGPYEIPNIKINSYCIVTNKPICGAYRGFGVPETNWPCENQMDALANAICMDPFELRMKNALYEGAISVTGEKLFSVGLKESLQKAADMIGWEKGSLSVKTKDGKLRGKGIACFWKMTSSPSNTSAIVKFNEDATAIVIEGGSEMGQGSHTIVCQIVAEELGIPLENVQAANTIDTQFTPFDKTTTSSRFTFMMGNALILACKDIKEQLMARAAFTWDVEIDKVLYENGVITEVGGLNRKIVVKDLASSNLTKEMPPIVGRGTFSTAPIYVAPDPNTAQSPRPTTFWIYGTQAAEVEVDPDTGVVEVVSFSAAHDCGKALNLHTCTQQVEGAIVMGLGHALREELIYDKGIPRNANMVDYKIPTVRDFPAEPAITFVDAPHKEGPYGAKGVGETALTATSAAVGNAIGQALGVRFFNIPIKEEHIIDALASKKRL